MPTILLIFWGLICIPLWKIGPLMHAPCFLHRGLWRCHHVALTHCWLALGLKSVPSSGIWRKAHHYHHANLPAQSCIVHELQIPAFSKQCVCVCAHVSACTHSLLSQPETTCAHLGESSSWHFSTVMCWGKDRKISRLNLWRIILHKKSSGAEETAVVISKPSFQEMVSFAHLFSCVGQLCTTVPKCLK